MARVLADPLQSVEPGTPSTPYQNIQSSPADFGAAGAQAMQQLGQAGSQAVGTGLEIATQQAHLHNQIAANAAFNNLEQASLNISYGDPNVPGDRGLMGLQGEEALRQGPAKIKQLQDLRDQISDGLSNPFQRLQFDNVSRRFVTFNEERMRSHLSAQTLVWGNQTAAAQQSLAVRGAGTTPDDDVRFNATLTDAVGSVEQQAQINGWSPDKLAEERANLVGKMQLSRVIGMSANDPVRARDYLQAHAADIDPHLYASMAERLQNQVDKVQRDGVAQSVLGGGPVPRYTGAVPEKVRQAAEAQGLEPSVALASAQIESRMGTLPDRPGSQYRGVFQMGPQAWADRGGTDADRGDPDAQVSLGVANLVHSQGVAQQALGRQPAGFETYLVHQQGDAGGPALLRADPSQNAVDALAPAYRGDRDAARSAIVNNGGSPDMTAGRFVNMWAAKFAAAGGGHGSDLDAQLAQVRQLGAEQGLSFDAQRGAESLVMAAHAREQALGAQERQSLRQSAGDLIPALEQGMDEPIPEARIRAAFPPDQADRMMMQLNVAKGAGQLFRAAQFMSPDQEQQARAMLETPGTVQASGIQARRGQLVGPGVNPVSAPADGSVASPAANPEDPTAMRLRLQVAQRFEALLAQKHASIAADPAAYAALNPDVAKVLSAVRPGDAASIQAGANATLGLQRQLGVPEDGLRVLTNSQVGNIAAQLTRANPADQDVAKELDGVAQQYGPLWPKVFGELVQHGKLSPDYQVLAAMDTPGQAAARTDFQRMLSFAAQKGGVNELTRNLPDGAERTIKQGLDGALANFERTTRYNDGGLRLADTVRDSTEHLAAYYVRQGDNPDAAVSRAAQGILGRYDFDGSMRVPKGMLPLAREATANAAAALRPEDLGEVQGNQRLTPQEREDIVLRGPKLWVPNRDDSGLAMMSVLRNSARPIQVRRADGSPVEVKFSDMARTTPAPQPGGGATGMVGNPFRDGGATGGGQSVTGNGQGAVSGPATTVGPAAPGGT